MQEAIGTHHISESEIATQRPNETVSVRLSNDEDLLLSWIAGFFEGEGCVGYDKHNDHMQLSIDQMDREPLALLKERFGGCLVISHREKEPYGGWKWRVTCRQALNFALAITPFVRTEKSRKKLHKMMEWYTIHPIRRKPYGTRWPKLSEDQKKKFVALWTDGVSCSAIAKEFGINKHTVWNWTKFAKLPRRNLPRQKGNKY